ncbi:nucleotide exchange factor GrpE [Candidatus Bathyarchaeota archaeon]|nr:nucleotide exchange factor GrpE [Candidatus Bathyarchaeota archaeon]
MNSEPDNPKKKKLKTEETIALLEKRLSETQKLADTYLTQLKYVKADLENIQKQSQKRSDEAIERAHTRFLSQLLPIADELLIAVTNLRNEEKHHQAVSMVYNKLMKFLEQEGIKPIKAVGEKFDPYYHEAVLEVETDDYDSGKIVEEIRKGYTYKDKVLRASMVKVARALSKKEN